MTPCSSIAASIRRPASRWMSTPSSQSAFLAAIADKTGLGVARLERSFIWSPAAAQQLRPVIEARKRTSPVCLAVSRTGRRGAKSCNGREQANHVSRASHRRLEARKSESDNRRTLWAAGELPELAAAEQLSLLLIGFDLTFQFDANSRSITIAPLEQITEPESRRNVTKSAPQQYLKQPNSSQQQAGLHAPRGRKIRRRGIKGTGHSDSTGHCKSMKKQFAQRQVALYRVSFSVENADQDGCSKATNARRTGMPGERKSNPNIASAVTQSKKK